jgi:ABC-type cobalamin/Fe3+-siderophores transport system ATPase subunit
MISPVHATDLTYSTRGNVLLGPLSLNISDGECIGVLGSNGAGKSTLLNLLNCTLPPSSGNLSLFGVNPWRQSESSRCQMRTRIGTVLQRCDYNAMSPFTVRNIVAMGRLGFHGMAGRLTRVEKDRIDPLLEEFNLLSFADKAYRQLSGGEQQKAQIARAILQAPELLLLDEPTAGLDPDWQEKLVLLVENLVEKHNMTLVMTTHVVHHLPACCNRLILLRKGQILFDGKKEEGLTSAYMTALYGCPMEIIRHDKRHYCVSRGAQ